MPRIAGKYSLPPSYKATSGQKIRTEQHNPPLEDIAQALSDSLPRDGSAPMTGALPMNGRKITSLGAGVNAGDAVRRDQVMLYSPWLSSVSGLTIGKDKMVYASGVSTAALTTLTPFARTVLDDADAVAMRTTLGIDPLIPVKANKAEAEAGADDDKYMTPLRTAQAIAINQQIFARGAINPAAGTWKHQFGFDVTITKPSTGVYEVVFETERLNKQYQIGLSCEMLATDARVFLSYFDKTKYGFSVRTTNVNGVPLDTSEISLIVTG